MRVNYHQLGTNGPVSVTSNWDGHLLFYGTSEDYQHWLSHHAHEHDIHQWQLGH